MRSRNQKVTMSRSEVVVDAMADRIVKAWNAATDVERAEGLAWYENARAIARALGETHWGPGRSRRLDVAAAILAVLSPAISWGQCVNAAFATYRNGKCEGFTYGRNCNKANAIMRAAVNARESAELGFISARDVDQLVSMAILDNVRGPKVTSFYHCIYHGGQTDVVCVDRHAVHIALGQRLNDETRSYLLGKTKTSYNGYVLFEGAYQQAARTINAERVEANLAAPWVWAAQVQAVTWVRERNLLEGRAKGSASNPADLGDLLSV